MTRSPKSTAPISSAVLITGGAGFIGSAYLRLLVPEKPDTTYVCLDALTYAGNLANLRPLFHLPNFRFVRGSVTNSDLVALLFEEHHFSQVVHFAAESHVDRSILGEMVFVETNIVGTQVLLQHVRNHGARLVLISTDEVYGDLGPADAPFSEGHPIHPSSPYSASKAAADHLVLAAHRTFGTDVVITRCSNNYGPHQFPEKLIPLMISNALDDKPLPVYGDGKNVRDWIYVDDHVRGIAQVARAGRTGQVYNLGGRCERENISIVKAILAELGKPESLIQYVTDRPGHDRRYAIDFTKAERELGWQPKATFEEHLPATIHWYVDHRQWCRDILSGAYRDFTVQGLRESGESS